MFSLTASSSPSDALSEAPSDLSTFVQSKVEFKTRLERYTPLNPNDDTVHFLEIFFKFLPEDGKYHLSEGVVGCTTDASLRQLVSSLDTGLLRPIKAHGGKTPAITPSPRFGVEDSIEELNSMDFEPISRNEQRRLRNKCLSRDGQMCVISKAHNEDAHPPPDSLFAPLETAHIIPFSLASFSGEEERLRTSTIWTNIYRYFPSLRSRMNFTLDNVNEVENAMMLIPSLHTEFGRFHFALEATTTIHRYRVKTFKNFTTINNHFLPTNRIVTFTNNDTRYPLPHPVLIEIHTAIANILNATGRGELVERIQRELGDSAGVLAKDGSTDIGHILSCSLLNLLTQPKEYAPQDMKQPLSKEQTLKGDDVLKENH
ncbi:conserved hypothetical protein [Histoplasma capsulatum var. duboisii H88]|uniref:HNH nuclease domain-containing protein n=1 Tax=Ajellomyces capsulatus (strain H88) TaxID=544711 RepID=F0URW5_AJEC8|nr:conserved hypothetical protein [Histoplasma capsulatum var. duboisii H88]QSS50651.1 hypothetical protein I7I53_11419 [Histoplasma capsulatum var. duboisii H88]